jgi:hypothetical protein
VDIAEDTLNTLGRRDPVWIEMHRVTEDKEEAGVQASQTLNVPRETHIVWTSGETLPDNPRLMTANGIESLEDRTWSARKIICNELDSMEAMKGRLEWMGKDRAVVSAGVVAAETVGAGRADIRRMTKTYLWMKVYIMET